MKKIDSILFDLDGTLTESGIGITRCAAYALEKMGLPVPDDLNVFIGPPLRETFPKYGVKEEDTDEAIRIFRSRYTTVGKFENKPYEGVEEMLKQLKDEGYHLYVATSKPEPVAIEILDHFGLSGYFDLIAGASLDASRESKSDVIAYLLKKIGDHSCVMVGDTEFDAQGAEAHGIPCIWVKYGYGTEKSMKKYRVSAIADSPQGIVEALKNENLSSR